MWIGIDNYILLYTLSVQRRRKICKYDGPAPTFFWFSFMNILCLKHYHNKLDRWNKKNVTDVMFRLTYYTNKKTENEKLSTLTWSCSAQWWLYISLQNLYIILRLQHPLAASGGLYIAWLKCILCNIIPTLVILHQVKKKQSNCLLHLAIF